MATLQATSLIDCLYIPDFIASGTKMVFNNATTPTSWTKDTTYNNYTFRVVNGSVSTGGENPFSSLMSSTFPISLQLLLVLLLNKVLHKLLHILTLILIHL